MRVCPMWLRTSERKRGVGSGSSKGDGGSVVVFGWTRRGKYLAGASMAGLRRGLGAGLLDGARMDGGHVVCRSVLGGWLGAIFDVRQCALGWLGLRGRVGSRV